MSNTTATATCQPSFPLLGVLGLIFITLKLTGVISWSWWLVLLPFYGGLALLLAFLLIAALVAGAADVIPSFLKGLREGYERRRR